MANMNVAFEIASTKEIARWLVEKLRACLCGARRQAGHPSSAMLVALFSGDRLTCCDEAIVARDEPCAGLPAGQTRSRSNGDIAGLVTLSPDGEAGEGPSLVGLWVEPAWRRRGIGTAGGVSPTTIRAVERMVERSLVPVQVDLHSTIAARVIDSLPQHVRAKLAIHKPPPVADLLEDQTFISTQ